MERLIAAILLKAVEDWSDPRQRQELEEFLESDWFPILAKSLDLDPPTIRDQLRQGSYRCLNIRAAYR